MTPKDGPADIDHVQFILPHQTKRVFRAAYRTMAALPSPLYAEHRLHRRLAQIRLDLVEELVLRPARFWPDIPELEAGGHIWAFSVPASYVGGDLYDIIPQPDESLLAYIADVSDKGVPAALIMAALSTKIRSEARIQTKVNRILENVNNSMHRLISEEGFFATIVLVRDWPDNGKIEFSLAGHLQPLWIVESRIGNLPQLDGISLGVKRDVKYEKKEIFLSPGESILLFTDGVTEAENNENQLFGNDRLIGYIEDTRGPPWGKGLLDQIGCWRGDAKVNDDLTILEIWRD